MNESCYMNESCHMWMNHVIYKWVMSYTNESCHKFESILINIHTLSAEQHTAAHCNTQQHTAAHCSTLQHTAAHCNTLQHTATHCNKYIKCSKWLICALHKLNESAQQHQVNEPRTQCFFRVRFFTSNLCRFRLKESGKDLELNDLFKYHIHNDSTHSHTWTQRFIQISHTQWVI